MVVFGRAETPRASRGVSVLEHVICVSTKNNNRHLNEFSLISLFIYNALGDLRASLSLFQIIVRKICKLIDGVCFEREFRLRPERPLVEQIIVRYENIFVLAVFCFLKSAGMLNGAKNVFGKKAIRLFELAAWVVFI